jgi:hypothetical protein
MVTHSSFALYRWSSVALMTECDAYECEVRIGVKKLQLFLKLGNIYEFLGLELSQPFIFHFVDAGHHNLGYTSLHIFCPPSVTIYRLNWLMETYIVSDMLTGRFVATLNLRMSYM